MLYEIYSNSIWNSLVHRTGTGMYNRQTTEYSSFKGKHNVIMKKM